MPEEGTQKSRPPKLPAIHTMQDDLLQAKAKPSALPISKKLPQNGKVEDLRPPPVPAKTKASSPASSPPITIPKKPPTGLKINSKNKAFPLPSQFPGKESAPPAINKPFLKNGGKLSLPFPQKTASPGPLWKTITIIAIIFAIGAIVAGISLFTFNLLSRSPSDRQTTDIASVIPSSASLVVHYSFSDSAQREDIQNIWDQTTPAPTLTALLSGDPRLLMTDANLNDIYYVVLPNVTQPFLIVRQTDFTRNRLFSHTIPISVSEINDWYVAHASDTDQYTSTLDTDTGNSADTITNFPGSLPASSNELTPPITILLNQTVTSQIRRDIAGIRVNNQSSAMMTISAFPEGNRTIKIQSTLLNAAAGLTNQQQLSFLPDDITSAYLGSNFKEDFEQQMGFKTAQRSLSSISSLIKQLTESYAYYRRVGEDGQTDFGLIITVPPSMQETLTLGNAAFEELLPSFLTFAFQTAPASPPVFQETIYQNVPLRYSNIPNTAHALDYAIIDDQLIISTSQEGMQKTIQTFQGQSESVLTSASFTPLFNSWGLLPAANTIIIGRLLNKDILSILPVQPNADNVNFGVAISQSAIDNNTTLQGILQINSGE